MAAEGKPVLAAQISEVLEGAQEEEYVPWFDHIPGVDRTLMNEDTIESFPCTRGQGGEVEVY